MPEKLDDIDWRQSCIRIIQEKTNHQLVIPMTNEIGNAIVDYLLEERPNSRSPYVFLGALAPYRPLVSHAGIRKVLFTFINDSGIEPDERIYGTRITRHSAASRILYN